ncbi:hypothetical protein CC80DRAFT_490154 [Byssothecium circinans]|uniref:Aminoglycoside phosphotransferase domain-containing protein n=1 Tax=Byssothecium circinans TaxID=147558 RepID=A0A6A5U5E6_9PLEO|nr:hypothetical protein CC80DRAFT_490154 [Byssothecium circinans]
MIKTINLRPTNFGTTHLGNKKYIITEEHFIKSEYYPGELQANGWPTYPCKRSSHRLQNEAAALELIRQHTSIPVPVVHSCQRDEKGVMRLVVQHIDGITASSVVNQCRKPQGRSHVDSGRCAECEEIVADKVNTYIEGTVIPQLQKLTSSWTGLNGFVLPPPRIEQYDRRDTWAPKQSSVPNDYVFCHADLARTNILVHPTTLDVVCIIDWETAGYFPAQLERPLWRLNYMEYMQTFEDKAKIDEEIALLTGQS